MLLRFLIYLFINSLLLNFTWEITQMPYFSDMGWGQHADLSLFIRTHWIVSLKDAAMIVTLYLLVGLVLSNWYWGRHFYKKRIGLILALGFFWSVIIEYYHVILRNDWGYLASMPLLPVLNVGLLPVLQMLILPLLAIYLSRKNLFV